MVISATAGCVADSITGPEISATTTPLAGAVVGPATNSTFVGFWKWNSTTDPTAISTIAATATRPHHAPSRYTRLARSSSAATAFDNRSPNRSQLIAGSAVSR